MTIISELLYISLLSLQLRRSKPTLDINILIVCKICSAMDKNQRIRIRIKESKTSL